ncbi:T9SS type A sorting domain-containing protein, partial [candidate division WOR-3 bacterium]|nr:T9SS type A sorting domain-containing protein [candidate division WOR-3 bacterium]
NDVTSVCVDNAGYKWFGTAKCGISMYDDSPVGILESVNKLEYKLLSYPNPFREKTVISYQLSVISKNHKPITCYQLPITLSIYDITGRLIRTITPYSSRLTCYEVTWDGTDETGEMVKTGVYFIKLQTESGRTIGTGKTIFIK